MSHIEEHNLIHKIMKTKDSLPKKQKQLCDYILKNYQSLGLVTVKELADLANVGVSTVMRTVDALGYENFYDFRKDIYEESLPTDSKWVLKKSLEDLPAEKITAQTIVQVWKESIHLLERSLTNDLINNFEAAIECMKNADFINVLGTRPYKAAALYFEQLLGEFYPRIRQLSHDTETIFDKILQFEKEEILFVFAFEPYTNVVINAAKQTYELGNKIILVTDHISCPLIPYASIVLKLEVSELQFSMIPIMALIDAIAIEIGKQTSEKSIKKLKLLEETLKKHKITYTY